MGSKMNHKTLQKIMNQKLYNLLENIFLELQDIKSKLETPWESIWDPNEKKTFWYHEIIVTSPPARESEID
jgi:hypothetical protein